MSQDVPQGRGSGGDENSLSNWLLLEQIPAFGIRSLVKLLSFTGHDLAAIFLLSTSDLVQLGLKPAQIHAIQHPNLKIIEKIQKWRQSAPENFVLTIEDCRYPPLLLEIARPPMLLYGRGNISVIKQHQIAMVGSRNPTVLGQENAAWFASLLVESGWVVTSGLALGIDGDSHRGALSAGGQTIAVMGAGIDRIYPRRHTKLAHEIILQHGCILSEFAPGVPARPENFPRRNRIISGLSLGTLIVEAAIKSGSLITARYALEQNREVLAVPGNIHNPLAKGGNYLIKQGAKMVECIEDINEEFQNLSHLMPLKDEKNLQKSATESLASDKLLDSVDFEVTIIDLVAQRSGMPITEVLAKLLEYELRGLVASVPGGYIKLRGK